MRGMFSTVRSRIEIGRVIGGEDAAVDTLLPMGSHLADFDNQVDAGVWVCKNTEFRRNTCEASG
jgi:hypothetical protein